MQDVGERTAAMVNRTEYRRENSMFWIAGTAAGLFLAEEILILAYRYFFTYTFVLDFSLRYVRDMLLRSALFGALSLLVYPLLRKLYGIDLLRQRQASKEGTRF